jgi:hypothetical protein
MHFAFVMPSPDRSTRYESEHNDVKAHKKSGGQMGQAETAVESKPEAEGQKSAERGAQTSENIRYGQAISEQGVGGFTNSSSGEANQEGYGQQQDQTSDTSDAIDSRKVAGYGGEEDMDRNIGA